MYVLEHARWLPHAAASRLRYVGESIVGPLSPRFEQMRENKGHGISTNAIIKYTHTASAQGLNAPTLRWDHERRWARVKTQETSSGPLSHWPAGTQTLRLLQMLSVRACVGCGAVERF
jgi:hypothetical protein